MRDDLHEWEEYLKPYFEQIRVLGEIPLSRLEVEQIGQLIRTHIQKKGLTRATHDFQTVYPRTFITYLALSAAFNTEAGYWGGIIDAVGISDTTALYMSNHHWGKSFIEITRKFGLRDFSHIGAPDPYVTAIRLHGGIPTYSLPDFFEHILLPSIRKPEFAELPSGEMVKAVLASHTIRSYVNAPVIYYLENGRSAAVEFVENCRRMARAYEQTHEILDAEDYDLPHYVVQTFQQYMEDQLEFARGRQIHPWRLYLDAYGPDFYVYLPPQTIEGVQASAGHFWEIEMVVSPQHKIVNKEPVRVRRRGVHLQTEERQLPLEYLVQRLNIAFMREEQTEDQIEKTVIVIRSWKRQILPGPDRPLLVAFRYNDGQYCHWNQALPGEALWLIYPSNVDLQAIGKADKLEVGAKLTGPWVNWQLEAWDLSAAIALRLLQDGREICSTVPVQTRVPEPLLVGENFLAQNVDINDVRVYIGEPPSLRIPLREGHSVEQESRHWQIAIESRWAADPPVSGEKHPLSEFADHLVCDEQTMMLPLAALLGASPRGTYQIHAFGPLGMRSTFRFRVWPKMEIEGLQPYYLPSEGSAQPARFSLWLEQGCDVQAQPGSEGVTIDKLDHRYEITVGPEKTTADFNLIYPIGDEPVRLPLALAIPRLSWALPQGLDEVEIEWSTQPIKRSLDELLQSSHATLYLSLPLVTRMPLVLTLQLVDPELQKVFQKSRAQEARPKQSRWRFALGEFFDTLRALEDQPVFEFRLEILDFENDQQWLVPLLCVSRTLQIHDVRIEYLEPPRFRLCWIEPRPLRNRRVHIWSEWQPWSSPIEITIPDEAQGELLVSDVSLPPSYYRIQFFTAAPWEDKNPPPLPPSDSHLVQTTKIRERLSGIDNKLRANPDNFLLHFEKTCILETAGDLEGRNAEIQWCYRNLQFASPQQIVAFHQWLAGVEPKTGEPRDLSSQKAVRIYMFRPENLQRLFKHHPPGDQVRSDYLRVYRLTSLVMPESALLILEHDDDPGRIMQSLRILVKRRSSDSLPKIVERIEKGQLSDADAEDLLALDPEFTLPALAELPESSIKSRLVQRLANRFPGQRFFVMRGYWIRTLAGWGQIDSIHDMDGNELPYFNRHTDKPKLRVTLRPEHSPEKIEVNLSDGSLVFLNAQKVYQCNKADCRGFISANVNLVTREHNRAAHMGIGAAFRQEPAELRFHQEPTYTSEPPETQFE